LRFVILHPATIYHSRPPTIRHSRPVILSEAKNLNVSSVALSSLATVSPLLDELARLIRNFTYFRAG